VIGVPVDDQTAQPVRFAEDQSHRGGRFVQSQAGTKRHCLSDAGIPERFIQWLLRIPGVQADAQTTGAIDDSASDKTAFVGYQIDDVTITALAFQALDRRVEYPGMVSEKRAGLVGLDYGLSHGESRCGLPRI
jgi:hypothetical protein